MAEWQYTFFDQEQGFLNTVGLYGGRSGSGYRRDEDGSG